MSQPSKTKKCIFCGSNENITKEHIFGQWLKKHSKTTTPVKTSHETSLHALNIKTGEKISIPRKPGRLNRQGPALTHQLRIVCQSCNNSWMSKFQDLAKPIMLQLYDGAWPNLDKTNLHIISTWAVITTMVLEFADPDTIAISQEDRQFVKDNQKPPPSFQAYIGACDIDLEGAWHKYFQIESQDGSTKYHAQTTTIIWGKYFIHIVSMDSGYLPDPTIYSAELAIKQLWPIPENLPERPGVFTIHGLERVIYYLPSKYGLARQPDVDFWQSRRTFRPLD